MAVTGQSAYERELKALIAKAHGVKVIRSAGSMGEGDLVVVYSRISLGEGYLSPAGTIIEVKATREKKFFPAHSDKLLTQYADLLKGQLEGFDVWYAICWKRQKTRWTFHRPATAKRGRAGGISFIAADGLTFEQMGFEPE